MTVTSIAVVGCGYLGAVHAACMADLGHDVVGLDVDPERVEALNRGVAPFHEPGLDDLLARGVAGGRLRFTTSPAEVGSAEIAFVCVGTPQRRGELAADVSQVDAAFDTLRQVLTTPGALVVGKSTVPVGTAARISAGLAGSEPHLELVWNPEFLREGHAIEDTLHPDRLVLGVTSAAAEARLREVYAAPIAEGTPVVVTDYATAELVKVAANSFLATKISFINAMAELCEAGGGDVVLLADAIGHDKRIGRSFLNAGLGFGGGCLPKDIRAFMARAGELGADQALTFLREVDTINMRRRSRMVDLALESLGPSPIGHRVAVLGAAFKPHSDDIRDSPALNVAAQLQLRGADVVVADPAAVENARRLWPGLSYADSAEEACRDADLVLLLTEWPEYVALDPVALGGLVRHRAVIDGRNALDPERWRGAGWSYRAMGRPSP